MLSGQASETSPDEGTIKGTVENKVFDPELDWTESDPIDEENIQNLKGKYIKLTKDAAADGEMYHKVKEVRTSRFRKTILILEGGRKVKLDDVEPDVTTGAYKTWMKSGEVN